MTQESSPPNYTHLLKKYADAVYAAGVI